MSSFVAVCVSKDPLLLFYFGMLNSRGVLVPSFLRIPVRCRVSNVKIHMKSDAQKVLGK